MTNPIGCAQLTWKGVEEGVVLDEIAKAGYDGSPPRLDGKRPAAETSRLYCHHGLRPAPGYFAAAYWHADLRERIVANARRAARLVRELKQVQWHLGPWALEACDAAKIRCRSTWRAT